MEVRIESLREHGRARGNAALAALLRTVAAVYMQEWGWHYSRERDIDSVDAMVDDLRANHLDRTWVALCVRDAPGQQQRPEFVGTVAVLDEDLASHRHLRPWVASLYVAPRWRRRGIGRQLADAAVRLATGTALFSPPPRRVYLWCYTERERRMYTRWGFEDFGPSRTDAADEECGAECAAVHVMTMAPSSQ
jgi:GNAT superfamily N-acetyltransferase